MSNFTSFWKIVSPKTRKQLYSTLSTDAYDPRTTDQSSLAAVTWYSQIMRGPGSRAASYKQYDAMDSDIDISRSMDIIAEEMSGKDDKTELPFEIQWQKEDNQDVSDTTIITVRAALRQWSQLQDLKKRVFSTSRCMIKYGDCFFRKSSDTRKYAYVDPSLVIGIEIDEIGTKLSYHLKRQNVTAQNSYQGTSRSEQVDIVPAAAMIHFSMCDDMGDSAPFGASVLRPIFRVYRQLSMLEDAVIIYRIVRAPERRVFYIDVGNMNQQQVKRYLESIKNEIRQKRTPGTQTNGVKDSVDGSYDPMCLTLDTRIPLLDGRTLSLTDLISEHEQGTQNWVYSCDPVTGAVKPGEIVWAGKTRLNTQVVKLTFDNGKTITCTPDHKFPVQGIGPVRADELTTEMSLMPFNRRWVSQDGGYEEVYDIHLKKWKKIKLLVELNSVNCNLNQSPYAFESIQVLNHKLTKIEYLTELQDTGCITVGEGVHGYHNFATESEIFASNSLQEDYFFGVTAAGKGSRVETLPGGAEDFGTNLLRQFQDKIFRGLRIPTSYMGSSATGGSDPQTNDGKVGIAYIEELRFANFISRLQDRLNEVYDAEFKIYLKVCGLRVDDEVFSIKLPDPANFALYRQAALDADLITSFNNIQENKFISRRFMLKRYLGLTDDELQMNEVMLKEERNLMDDAKVSIMQQLYDPAVYENRDAISIDGSDSAPGDDAEMDPSAGLLDSDSKDTPFNGPPGADEPEAPEGDKKPEPEAGAPEVEEPAA